MFSLALIPEGVHIYTLHNRTKLSTLVLGEQF